MARSLSETADDAKRFETGPFVETTVHLTLEGTAKSHGFYLCVREEGFESLTPNPTPYPLPSLISSRTLIGVHATIGVTGLFTRVLCFGARVKADYSSLSSLAVVEADSIQIF